MKSLINARVRIESSFNLGMMPTVWAASEQALLWGRDEEKAKECEQMERGGGEGRRRGYRFPHHVPLEAYSQAG